MNWTPRGGHLRAYLRRPHAQQKSGDRSSTSVASNTLQDIKLDEDSRVGALQCRGRVHAEGVEPNTSSTVIFERRLHLWR